MILSRMINEYVSQKYDIHQLSVVVQLVKIQIVYRWYRVLLQLKP